MNTASIRRRVLLATATAAASGLLLAGCAGTPTSEPSGSEGSNPDASITLALTLFPDNLDIRNTSGTALEQTLIDNVYQGLVSRDATGAITPTIAEDFTISEDGLTYTFDLHEGVTFSNGHALTASDVLYSFNDLIDNADVRADSAVFASVASIEAPDDLTVVITLTAPNYGFLYNLAGRAGLVIDEEATNDLLTTAVGSGPFLVDEFNAQDSLVLVRDDDYWGEPAGVAEVVFQLFTDANASLNALLDGTLDFATVDATLVSQIEGNEDFELVQSLGTDKFQLQFNNKDSVLSDIRVRQAIRHAIDHEAFIQALGGNGIALAGPIPALDPGHEDLTDLYPYDPELAKTLLAEAGYADGLTLTLEYAAFYDTILPVGDLLRSQLAEVGITLEVIADAEFATWINNVLVNQSHQLSFVDHNEPRDFGNWANAGYYFGYDSAAVQASYQAALESLTEEEYAANLAKAARQVSEDAAADWLVNPTWIVAVRDGISGIETDQVSARHNVTKATVAAGSAADN